MQPRKLAIVTSHPIQYYAPLFRALAGFEAIDVRVFYTWSQTAGNASYDPGFGKAVSWDVPLLEGYAYQFVVNLADRPGTDHFGGIKNPTLIREIEGWQADAVLVYGWNLHSHLQVMRYFRKRIPVLFRGDSTLLDERVWWRKLLRRISLRWVYSHVDIALAVGSNSKEYFEWCGVPQHRIVLAPHSVDTARFMDGESGHARIAGEWREKMRIPADATVFLFAGKLQRKKAPELLLDAFLRLPRGSHLIYVGSGDLEARLKAKAVARNDVHFLPFQNQSIMPTVYRLADVFVLPSRGPGETWGLALNEAMACGTAVIASARVGGARDLIRPAENGWVFEAEDLSGLVRLMREAISLRRSGLRTMGALGQVLSTQWSSHASARRICNAVVSATIKGTTR